MDIITQGLLGGVLAQSVADEHEKKRASFIGVFAGLLADADFFIRSADDPLLNLEYHRHFSHALIFVPVGAAIATLLLWPFMRHQITTARLYIFCLLGYSMSGVLDASTSYGTHLFWPFSDERIAWNLIAIIDPVFSLILLVTFMLGLWFKLKRVAYVGLLLAASYMSLGYVQQQRATNLAEELISSRQHTAVKYVVKPTMANNMLWRSVYNHDGRIYVDAIRVSFFAENTIYEGESVKQFKLDSDLPGLAADSTLYSDIQRFTIFSDGYVAFDPEQDTVIGDMRYSMLANSTKPLWGIVINDKAPEQHADYRFFRNSGEEVREAFINMLFGRCNDIEC